MAKHIGIVAIEVEIPEPEDRRRINEIIFDDLVYGRFHRQARAYFKEVIAKLKAARCDAVALACTEIPVLLDESECPLPVLDSTRILARAALREATSGP